MRNNLEVELGVIRLLFRSTRYKEVTGNLRIVRKFVQIFQEYVKYRSEVRPLVPGYRLDYRQNDVVDENLRFSNHFRIQGHAGRH